MKLSIIIPVYNEANTLDDVIAKIKNVKLEDNIIKEIIIVNDGSTDETYDVLSGYDKDPLIRTYHKKKNSGKSEAVRIGIEHSEGDILLIQDADLEYDPINYSKLIEPIIKNKTKVVYGSRFKGSIENMRLVNRISNIISNVTLRLLYRTHITDVNTCYKAFRREVFKDISIDSKRFMMETEITGKLLKAGYDIQEVPISYRARSKKEGKKITWFGALQMYGGIIKYRFFG
ncbi:MAG: glycosyltransferase family 2 protein [Candidatus Omnitrophota bacterium]